MDQVEERPLSEKKAKASTAVMVQKGLLALADRRGTSLQALKNYIIGHYAVDPESFKRLVTKYVKKGLESGELIQVTGKGANGRFKLSVEFRNKTKTRSVPRAKKLDNDATVSGTISSETTAKANSKKKVGDSKTFKEAKKVGDSEKNGKGKKKKSISKATSEKAETQKTKKKVSSKPTVEKRNESLDKKGKERASALAVKKVKRVSVPTLRKSAFSATKRATFSIGETPASTTKKARKFKKTPNVHTSTISSTKEARKIRKILESEGDSNSISGES